MLSERKKEKLKDLELQRGGTAFTHDRSKATPVPTVVFSLGGLGGRALNMLKGKFVQKVGACDHVFFRMLDTACDEMKQMCRMTSYRYGYPDSVPNANMEPEEMISVYQLGIDCILSPREISNSIRKWLNPSLIGRRIENTGAQQTRQIGRAMLVNERVYDDVRNRIRRVLSEVSRNGHARINLMIIAGISGGTGSGMIIDFSYMLHDICREMGLYYNLGAFLCTPDVQFLEDGIVSSNIIKNNLMRNGYAALKEIDYFMNIAETGSQYELQVGYNRCIISKRNIFDTCTLISGANEVGGYNKLTETIGRLTDQMLDMLTDIRVQSWQPMQLGNFILSNQGTNLQGWFALHRDRNLYHRYVSYKYSVFGYQSIMIPRDEILAYCVNKIYEQVLTEFNNLSLVNKNMMKEIYNRTNILNSGMFEQYAVTINAENPINRTVSIDGISKLMIRDNPMVGYEYACEACQDEVLKINSSFQAVLEEQLFDALKRQVDQVFEQYGPYVAMKAIEHTHDELNVGNSDEPFPGMIEMLENLSNKFMDLYREANHTYRNGGQQEILNAAEDATRIFAGKDKLKEYKRICCEQAVIAKIDTRLFRTLSDVLYNVSQRMWRYNHTLFGVYTSILREIQEIFNRDGQYFVLGRTNNDWNRTTCSIDFIKHGDANINHLKRYLDSLMSEISVQDLAQSFIRSMWNHKEKWLAQEDENHFDVVNEVRQLMDDCLTQNGMGVDLTEKIIVAAYSPTVLTSNSMNAIWTNNASNSPKIQALSAAANNIIRLLLNNSAIMGRLTTPFRHELDFGRIISIPQTSQLTGILNNQIINANGIKQAVNTSQDTISIVGIYRNIPLYMLDGMAEMHDIYVNSHVAGLHLDENNWDWRRCPNPYTIDSIALDLMKAGKPAQDIEQYEDYQILLKVKEQTEDGIGKYHFIEYQGQNMILYDIDSGKVDMKAFKEKLREEVKEQGETFELIPFMKDNGFIFRPETISIGNTDIDITLTSFDSIDMNDPRYSVYQEIPLPIPDIYKWMRSRVKYMDILEKNTKLFEELYEV